MSTFQTRFICVLSLAALFYGCAPQQQGGPPSGMAANVVVARAKQAPIEDRIKLVGSLVANESVDISAEVAGFINKVNFQEGETAKAGDVLFELDNAKQKARLAEAEAAFGLAEINRDRNQSLFDSKTIARQELDRALSDYDTASAILELRKTELDDTFIRAPFDGALGVREVSAGQYVQAGATLVSLVSLNPIKAAFYVPERFLRVVELGQNIRINIAAYPGEAFEGKVYFIAPTVHPTNRTVEVRAYIENAEQRLKPGMFGALNLVLEEKNNAITIPEAAIMVRGEQQIVAVVNEAGDRRTADFRPVKTGIRLDGRVEINEGLEPNTIVVVEGHQKIFFPGMDVRMFADSRGTPFEPENNPQPGAGSAQPTPQGEQPESNSSAE